MAQHMERQHDLAVSGMPSSLPIFTVDLDQFRHHATSHRDRHDAMPGATGAFETLRRRQSGNPERRTRLLAWAW